MEAVRGKYQALKDEKERKCEALKKDLITYAGHCVEGDEVDGAMMMVDSGREISNVSRLEPNV